MSARTGELLLDLVKLLRKYGPDELEAAARLTESRDFAEQIARVLRTTASAGRSLEKAEPRPSKGAAPRAASEDLEKVIGELAGSDPEKLRLLGRARDVLARGGALPPPSSTRAFAHVVGASPLAGRTRFDVAVSLLQSLTQLPVDELESAVRKLEAPPERGSTLRGWAGIILGDMNRKTPES
jgi:hypothetical protein